MNKRSINKRTFAQIADDEDYAEEPPKKIMCLDEDQTYVDESEEDTGSDQTTTEDMSVEESQPNTQDEDFIAEDMEEEDPDHEYEPNKPLSSQEWLGFYGDITTIKPGDTERQKKLRAQYAKIVPNLKRTKSCCDLFEKDCDHHKFDDKDPDVQPPLPSFNNFKSHRIL